jgi:hypothetical protein
MGYGYEPVRLRGVKIIISMVVVQEFYEVSLNVEPSELGGLNKG